MMRNLPPNGVAGLRAMFGEALETLAAAARHDHRESAAGEAADVTTGSCACWAFGHWVLVFCKYRARATVDACFIAHVSRHAAAALSVTAVARADRLQPPAADSAGCFAAGDGYLRARLRGALDLDLDWKDADMQCEGGPRPAGATACASASADRCAATAGASAWCSASPASAKARRRDAAHQCHDPVRRRETHLRHAGRRQVHGGLSSRSSAWRRSAARRAVYRVVARGFCLGPATSLSRE